MIKSLGYLLIGGIPLFITTIVWVFTLDAFDQILKELI